MTGQPPLEKGPQSAARARDFFLGLCYGEGGLYCPRCGAPDPYRLASDRLRCRACAYTFHEYSKRWLNRGGLPPEYWLAIIRYFARGLSIEAMAERLALSYNTVYRACTTLRLAIASKAPDGPDLLDKDNEPRSFCPNLGKGTLTRELCATCLSPVFGLRPDQSWVSIEKIKNLRAKDVFGWPLPLKEWRTLIYTGAHHGFASLLFCCCRLARRLFRHRFTGDPLPLDGSDFKSFAEEWMGRYHCLSPGAHPLYLKEIELRYNLRDRDLEPVLAALLCALVPNR